MSYEYFMSMLIPMLEGAKATVLLFVIAIVLSIPLGFLLTLAVRSSIKPISYLAQTFIYVMRGTPLLLQLLFFVFGLPLLPVIGEYLVFDRFVAATLAFILNYSAYFAEIFRGGLLSIDKGQYEACLSVNMTKWQALRTVILPQMVRIAIPPSGNYYIMMIKDTSLAFTIGVIDMMARAKLEAAVTYKFLEAYLMVGLIYWMISVILSYLQSKLENYVEKPYRKEVL